MTGHARRMAGRRFLAGFALAAALLPVGVVAPAAAATGWAEFGMPTASASFATGVTFRQPVTIDRPLRRVELLLGTAGSVAQSVILVAPPEGTGAVTLSHDLDPAEDGHIMPNTPLIARWRLVGADDPSDVDVGPEVRLTFEDDRFDWRTEAGDLVRVHWYEGGDAFGAEALEIGEGAVREASELLQVTETDPVDFFVYADQEAFYDALGPGTRENVGGQANAEIRTMFALISPGEINDSWVRIVIPHELAHLVFDTAASNPYHFPPRWLNEGLAVYLSQGYDASDRSAVERAAAGGTLTPLDGLTGQFPTSFERFSLAYAESVSAVDYLVRKYDQDALVSLIRSYADGRTDDEAFTEALGQDMTAFGDAWLEDLGAAPPTKFGPQPAPAGPVPSAWTGEAGGSAPPAAATSRPGATAGATPAPGSSDGDLSTPVLVVVIVIVVLGVVGVVALRRRLPGPGAAG
jgi:hypothetical protein